MIGVLGFESQGGLGIFLFITVSRTALGPTPPPIQWVPGALSLGVQQQGREADHSPQSSVEVKNAWSYTSSPLIRLHGVVLSYLYLYIYLYLLPVFKHHTVKTYRGRGDKSLQMSGQLHAPTALFPRINSVTHFTAGWVSPRASLYAVTRRKTPVPAPVRNGTSVPPLASHITDR
jgi:hypothetical protein